MVNWCKIRDVPVCVGGYILLGCTVLSVPCMVYYTCKFFKNRSEHFIFKRQYAPSLAIQTFMTLCQIMLVLRILERNIGLIDIHDDIVCVFVISSFVLCFVYFTGNRNSHPTFSKHTHTHTKPKMILLFVMSIFLNASLTCWRFWLNYFQVSYDVHQSAQKWTELLDPSQNHSFFIKHPYLGHYKQSGIIFFLVFLFFVAILVLSSQILFFFGANWLSVVSFFCAFLFLILLAILKKKQHYCKKTKKIEIQKTKKFGCNKKCKHNII